MERQFRLPRVIIFGWGAFSQIGEHARRLGIRALLVSGGTATQTACSLARGLMDAQAMEVTLFAGVPHDPSSDLVDRGVEVARKAQAELVVGVGGGSSLDVAKAIAGMFTLDGQTKDYLGPGARPVNRRGLPLILAPTTAGTAGEITQVSVLQHPDRRVKFGLKSPLWMAEVALVDPELTVTMPPRLTATTGLDTLAHAAESYLSNQAWEATDPLALQAISLVGRWLRTAASDGASRPAREGMAMASMIAGMAFSNTGVGLAHAISHPLGSLFGIPHGLACGVPLPYVMQFNSPARPEKVARIADALEPESAHAPEDAPAAVLRLLVDLGLPTTISELGITEAELPEIAELAAIQGSIRTNPRPVDRVGLDEVLRASMKPPE